MTTETLLQIVVLTLPIYALLTALIITRPLGTRLNLPHTRWGKPRRKNRPKRRGTRIRRRGPGDFTVEEEKPKPRGKPRGAKGGTRHTPHKVGRVQEAAPSRCPYCGGQNPQKTETPYHPPKKGHRPRRSRERPHRNMNPLESALETLPPVWKTSLRRRPGQR
ncbi:MAG: hypothetical protein ACTSUQ_13575 [Candidatus Freyarchaeota archaeon]